jgi:hypothetical protein
MTGVAGQHPTGAVDRAGQWLAYTLGGEGVDLLEQVGALPIESVHALSDASVRDPGVGEVGEKVGAAFQDGQTGGKSFGGRCRGDQGTGEARPFSVPGNLAVTVDVLAVQPADGELMVVDP